MIKAILVDDVEKANVLLRMKLAEHCPEVKIVGEAEDADQAIELIESKHPQLVFLDIGMAGKTGFDLLEEIKERNFHVIFVTAHTEYAIKAYRYSVTDYLLKPVNNQVLKEAVQKVKKMIDEAPVNSAANDFNSVGRRTLRIPSTSGTVFVYFNNIIRMEAD